MPTMGYKDDDHWVTGSEDIEPTQPTQPPSVPEQERPQHAAQAQPEYPLDILAKAQGRAPVRWPSDPRNQPPEAATMAEGHDESSENSVEGASVKRPHGGKALAIVAIGLAFAGDASYHGLVNNQNYFDVWQARLHISQSQQAPDSSHNQATHTPSVPATTAPTQAPTPTTTPSLTPEFCVAQLPLEVKFGQRIMAPIKGDTLESTTVQKAFSEHYIGGAILMTEPTNPKDGSINDFRKTQLVPIRIATDQEGGTVMRFKENAANLPSAAEAAKMPPDELEKKVVNAYTYLRSLGVSAVFAPVVDVAPLQGKTQIGESRLFGSDPKKVAETAEIYIRAGKKANMHVTIKHFPGMGSASGNTDKVVAKDPSLTELKKRDLVPYEMLSDSGADVMVGSPIVPGLTDDKPANLSPATYELLREDMGYKNAVVYTDDLSTPAINMPVDKAFVEAWKAGADMPLFVNLPKGVTLDQELTKIIDAGIQAFKDGKINEAQLNESVGRIFASKGIDACNVLKSTQHDQTTDAETLTAPATPTTSPSATPTEVATAVSTAKATATAGKK